MSNQPGEAPPCKRCGQHRDSNVHIAKYAYANYHPYTEALVVGDELRLAMGALVLVPTSDNWAAFERALWANDPTLDSQANIWKALCDPEFNMWVRDHVQEILTASAKRLRR